jgi:hypothetical protein
LIKYLEENNNKNEKIAKIKLKTSKKNHKILKNRKKLEFLIFFSKILQKRVKN